MSAIKNPTGTQKILVVDDESIQRLLMEQTLKQSGYDVVSAQNGAEALLLFIETQPDLVLMDIKMPVMDGLQACKKMRQSAHGNVVPVVLITGMEDHASIQKAFDAQATDFITKPVNREILKQRVRYFLQANDTLTALKLSDNRFRQISEISSDWFWETDENLQFTYFSEGLERHTNIKRTSLLGRNIKQVMFSAESVQPHPQEITDALKSSLEFRDIQFEMQDDDGQSVYCQASGSPILSDEGEFLGYRGAGSNITEKVKSARAIEQAKESAENANRAKSRFLSNMSHELRTPLNAITGFSQLLQLDDESPLSPDHRQYVDEISRAGEHLLKLINEILDLASIEAGRAKFNLESLEYADVIRESIQLITPLAHKRGITIEIISQVNKISVSQLQRQRKQIFADASRLKQVLLNLLSNAVKYNSDNGKITICCTSEDNNKTRISISDEGNGLDKQELDQLFIAFNRQAADLSNIEGTGIGLVISRNIVELMHGRMGVNSEPGKGSTFWFELPEKEISGNDSQQRHNNVEHIKAQKVSFEPSEKDLTILYIEDNHSNRQLLMQAFEKRTNINLHLAEDARTGFDLIEKHNPNLILLDINLPDMNGFEVLNKLKSARHTHHLPVIAVSAHAMPEDINKGMQVGFDAYLTKPIDIEKLMRTVDENMDPITSN